MAVYIRSRLTKARIREAPFVQFAERVLAAAGESVSELSIELVGDQRMRSLNRVYRRKDQTTDVLAFAMRESDNPHPSVLGDVVISIPTAQRQARGAGHSVDDELAALLIHGVLHLCGYDHERSEKEAQRMFRRERAILRSVRPVPSLMTSRVARRKRMH